MFHKRSSTVPARLLAGCILLFISCSPSPEEKFGSALERCRAGERSAVDEAAGLLMGLSSVEVIAETDAVCDGSVIWKKGASSVNMLFPQRADFGLLSGEMNLMRSAGSKYMAFCDGMDIFVFDWKSSLRARMAAGAEKSAVEALSLQDGDVFFFRDKRIYRATVEPASMEIFVNDTFMAPYSGYFNAAFFRNGKTMGLLLGVAGYYYFNSIDMEKGRVINSNIRMASSKLYMDEKSVLYIYGNTGNWSLTRFTFSSGRKENFQRYKDLVNIEIFSDMVLAEDSNGLWIARPGGENCNIPFGCELKGSCGRYAVMKYNGSLYCVDVEKFYDGILKIREAAPDIFKEWKQ